MKVIERNILNEQKNNSIIAMCDCDDSCQADCFCWD